MPLNITITNAGRAALVNAANTGTGAVIISEIALGSGQYTPAVTRTALQTEIKRVSTIAGLAVAADTLHVTIKDDSTQAYDVGEFGLYTDGGVLLAVYSQTGSWIVEKAAGSTLLLAVDIVLETINATNLTFGDIAFINPPATETVQGVAEIATQAETDAGTDDSRFITALKLKNWIKSASSTVAGIVKLSSSLSSTSTTVAATSSAVKSLYDNVITRAQKTTQINAGNGLTGGGDLSAHRTVTLGTPAQITDASTNSVSATGHSHAVDHASTGQRGIVQLTTSTASTSTTTAATPSAVKAANDNANARAMTSRVIAAGNGLTGGGDLSANRTVTLGTPAQITDASTNAVTATGHSHAVDHASTSARGIVQLSTSTASTSTTTAATPSAVKAAYDSAGTRALKTITITAGNGLTGGGDLSANRTVTLGTPAQITASSTNGVTATGHSHAVDNASETKAGIVPLATQAQVNAGTDDARAVTSKKLRAGVAVSLSSNGYLFLPSWLGGVGIQWGNVTGVTNTGKAVSFPIAFPTALWGLTMTTIGSTSAFIASAYNTSITGFTADTSAPGSVGQFWIAIGY